MCIFWVLGVLVRTPKPFRYWIPRCTWIFSLEAGGMVSVLLSHDGPRRGLWSSILLGTHRAGSISTFTLFRTRNLKIISSVIFCLLFPFRFLDILSHSDIGLLYLSFFFSFYFWAIICLILTSHPFIELFIFNFYDPPFLFHLISMFLFIGSGRLEI